MKTVNGKLITQEQNQLNGFNIQFENLGQKLQNLELEMTAIHKEKHSESMTKLKAIELSLQKLQRLCQRLFLVSIISTLGLASWQFWLWTNQYSLAKKSQPQLRPKIERSTPRR